MGVFLAHGRGSAAATADGIGGVGEKLRSSRRVMIAGATSQRELSTPPFFRRILRGMTGLLAASFLFAMPLPGQRLTNVPAIHRWDKTQVRRRSFTRDGGRCATRSGGRQGR